ncbi:hypothetical protein GOP47_0001427, partial [Adiantum capillus-veneris]
QLSQGDNIMHAELALNDCCKQTILRVHTGLCMLRWRSIIARKQYPLTNDLDGAVQEAPTSTYAMDGDKIEGPEDMMDTHISYDEMERDCNQKQDKSCLNGYMGHQNEVLKVRSYLQQNEEIYASQNEEGLTLGSGSLLQMMTSAISVSTSSIEPTQCMYKHKSPIISSKEQLFVDELEARLQPLTSNEMDISRLRDGVFSSHDPFLTERMEDVTRTPQEKRKGKKFVSLNNVMENNENQQDSTKNQRCTNKRKQPIASKATKVLKEKETNSKQFSSMAKDSTIPCVSRPSRERKRPLRYTEKDDEKENQINVPPRSKESPKKDLNKEQCEV